MNKKSPSNRSTTTSVIRIQAYHPLTLLHKLINWEQNISHKQISPENRYSHNYLMNLYSKCEFVAQSSQTTHFLSTPIYYKQVGSTIPSNTIAKMNKGLSSSIHKLYQNIRNSLKNNLIRSVRLHGIIPKD